MCNGQGLSRYGNKQPVKSLFSVVGRISGVAGYHKGTLLVIDIAGPL